VTRLLLAIETSCDETAAAVVGEDYGVRSSVVSSQVDLHARYGGVVPEIASRAHVNLLLPVVDEAFEQAGVGLGDVSAVAVTQGPGLIGALLVGISAGKALAMSLSVPVVAVNHLEGHLASVLLADPSAPYPQLALLVSGGHCILARAEAPGSYERLGQTKDDSVGEAYDKVARMLGLGYPGGPAVDRLAGEGRDTIGFPRPMLNEGYDFSFSGLKTAVANYLRANPAAPVEDVACSFADACMDVLCAKLERALEEFSDPVVSVVGGVAASPILRHRVGELATRTGSRLLLPPQRLATDNAAMIGVAGWLKLAASRGTGDDLGFGPVPSLPLTWSPQPVG
jgi:N6-L-threonylcarbamoyladenine synthase